MSLSVLVVLFALPMFAAFVLGLRYVVGKEHRLMLELARKLPCRRCQAVLGEESVALADALWERHMQRLFESKQVGKQRIVRNLDAVCPKCGQRYRLEQDASTFVPVEVVLAFEGA